MKALTTRGLTSTGSYNQGFLQLQVLQPGVLTTRGLTTRHLTTRHLTTRGSYKWGSYNQGFLQQGVLQPGVLTTRRSHNQGSYIYGFLQPGVLTTRGFIIRVSYNQGSYGNVPVRDEEKVNNYWVQRKSVLQLAIQASCSSGGHEVAQKSFQLALKGFLMICNLNSLKTFICPLGKLGTECISLIAKSTSPGLLDFTDFLFAHRFYAL